MHSSRLSRAASGSPHLPLHTCSRLHFKVAEGDEAVMVEDEVDFQDVSQSSLGLFQKLSKGFVPLAASVGFAVTPSPLIATRLAGAGKFTLYSFNF